MTLIVTDAGFSPDDFHAPVVALAALAAHPLAVAVDLGPGDDPAVLADRLSDLRLVRVAFPAFSDGRGFTVARRLRLMGYGGRLRASGHVIADQYAMCRRAGFDEVEIADDLAARQPEAQWTFRADWRDHDHRSRLRG